MQKFVEDTKWPYQQGIMKNMKMMRCDGLTKWPEGQKKRWRCANCGAPHSEWDGTCPHCGQTVANYQADD
jgi:rubrerythrin